VGCSSNSYTITEGSSTNPTYITYGSGSVGYNLPTYTISNPTCAPARSPSSTTGSYTAHTQLNQPVDTGGSNYQVRPINTALHLKYTFYIRIVVGTTTEYFGPYYLDTGCTSTALSPANSGSLSTTATNRNVGDSTSNFYTFSNPTVTRGYCSVISNYAKESDGTTDSTKVTESGS